MDVRELSSIIQIDGKDYEVVATRVDNKLTITRGDTTLAEFDGSSAKEVDIPEDTYSNDTPVVNPLGGIKAGDTFDNMPIAEVLTKLLYPYVAPVISSTSIAKVPDRVLEYGEEQKVSSLAVQVQKKSNPITSIKLIANAGSVDEVLEEKTGDTVKNGGNIPFSTQLTISKTYKPTLKFRVTDGTSTVDSGSISTTFVYPYYYGAIGADATATETIVEGLTKKVEAKGTKAWTFTLSNQKAVFAYPKSYGVLKSIINQNNYEVLNTFIRLELSIVGLDGTQQTYYVYISDGASTVTDFKYTFSY